MLNTNTGGFQEVHDVCFLIRQMVLAISMSTDYKWGLVGTSVSKPCSFCRIKAVKLVNFNENKLSTLIMNCSCLIIFLVLKIN